jgi:signal transduction histidine kinase
MFKRLRQLRISLAAKCQILFGTAVAAIIFAALFVPWQRIEQLTEQLNEKAAGAVADAVIGEHIMQQTALRDSSSAASYTTTAPSALFRARPRAPEGQSFPAPRLIGVAALGETAKLTRFEQSALSRFVHDPNARIEGRYNSTKDEFRYAAPLYSSARCVKCHDVSQPIMRPVTLASALGAKNSPALPTTSPATQPALIGMISVELPSQIKAREIMLNRLFLLLAGLIAGSLAIIIFYLITTRLILQPVRVLQETAQKVSEGDLNIRSDINTGDEFQQLSETFNVMLINLKRSADQLRAVNKSLDLKLGQLAETNVALYESNRLKSEFLANVSHELRTPLNSILGFAELLKDQSPSDSKSIRYLQNILSSGHHLLNLINGLLDLAKIEAGKMDVRSEPLSLSDMFEGLISLLKPLSEARQLTIVPSIAPDIPILHTDPAKLQQVLYNFLSNAIKFSPAGERIDLRAELSNGASVRLAVSDRGPGIDVDKHDLIFEKFRRSYFATQYPLIEASTRLSQAQSSLA